MRPETISSPGASVDKPNHSLTSYSSSRVHLEILEPRQLLSATLDISGFLNPLPPTDIPSVNDNLPTLNHTGNDEDDGHFHGHGCTCEHCTAGIFAHGTPYFEPTQVLGEEGETLNIEPDYKGYINIDDIPAYESRPGSENVIYLNFVGGTVSDTAWNASRGVESWNVKPYDRDGDWHTFSEAEQQQIFRSWMAAAEDFAPFDINVTTKAPTTITNTTAIATITSGSDLNGVALPHQPYGGIAYVGIFGTSFNTYYSHAWVKSSYGSNPHGLAGVIAHEVGHNLGLNHDGTGSAEYYGRHKISSSSNKTWSPHMGSSSGTLTQWSKGDYRDASNNQDDLAIISGKTGYRTDDHGDDMGSATAISTVHGSFFSETGIIETTDDPDVFSFYAYPGEFSVDLTPLVNFNSGWGTNLDSKLVLRDSSGTWLAGHNPSNSVSASIDYTITTEGTYYLNVIPVGVGDPFASTRTGYTSYGSLGQYEISGSYVYQQGNYAPLITSQPQSQDLWETDRLKLSVQAHGSPSLSYQWYKNNNLISGATSSTYIRDNIGPGAAGNYKVVVSNSQGSQTSSTAVVTVENLSNFISTVDFDNQTLTIENPNQVDLTLSMISGQSRNLKDSGTQFAKLGASAIKQTITAGGSLVIPITIQAGLADGTYQATRTFHTNNPTHPSFDVQFNYTHGTSLTADPEAIGESGNFTIDQTNSDQWHTVSLANTYDNPVVVMGPASFAGSQPMNVRVRNVTSNSFEFQLDEWDYLDGGHATETIGYLVTEAGLHILEDGTLLQAGNTSTDGASWGEVDFLAPYQSAPVVLSQITSTNDADAAVTRIRQVDTKGFEVLIQQEEAGIDTHASESVAWIALSPGLRNAGLTAETVVASMTHEQSSVSFTNTAFTSPPVLLAGMQTTTGTDPATLRYTSLTSDSATLFVEEEVSADEEINHATETVGVVALSYGHLKGASQIAHFEFEEAGSLGLDSSRHGATHNGTTNGSLSQVTDSRRGNVIDFEGGKIDIPDSNDFNLQIQSERTIALWFKADHTNGRQVLFEEGGGTRGLNIYIEDGQLYVGGWNQNESGWAGTFLNTDAPDSGNWHHVALTLNGSDTVANNVLTAFLDGVQFGSGEGSQLWAHGDNGGLGGAVGSSRFHDGTTSASNTAFYGQLDDVRIFNHALPAINFGESLNEAPVISSTTHDFFVENRTGIAYETLATDADGDTLTYTLQDRRDAASFSIDTNTGAISFISPPDFENPQDHNDDNIYAIHIDVSDGNLTTSQLTYIHVLNLNEAPVITSTTHDFFAEGNTGIAYQTLATDPENDTLTYSLVTDRRDSSHFDIDASTGAVSFISTPDYENPLDDNGDNIYVIFIDVSDGSLTTRQITYIHVLDINEAPIITSTNHVYFVEGQTGTAYQTQATDPENDTLTYSLVTDRRDSSLFNINASTGTVSFISAPDYENPLDRNVNQDEGSGDNTYVIFIDVTDGNLITRQITYIHVLDIVD